MNHLILMILSIPILLSLFFTRIFAINTRASADFIPIPFVFTSHEFSPVTFVVPNSSTWIVIFAGISCLLKWFEFVVFLLCIIAMTFPFNSESRKTCTFKIAISWKLSNEFVSILVGLVSILTLNKKDYLPIALTHSFVKDTSFDKLFLGFELDLNCHLPIFGSYVIPKQSRSVNNSKLS